MNDKTCAGFGVIADEPRQLNRRQAAAASTRTKVLAAARASFEEAGYERTTIRDLASMIGMSTGAVFAAFADKDAMYVAVYGHKPISPEVGRELLEALKGVVAVADRKTDEFDAARSAMAKVGG